jgi:sugar phosphate isomerase/epimerase
MQGTKISEGSVMKFGVCESLDNLELVERLGFDYIECAVSALSTMSDEDFEKAQEKVRKNRIKVERVNMLFPRTIKLIGKDASSPDEIRAYLEKAFARVKSLGGTIAVFGSGRSRNFPEDLPFAQAYRELVKATKITGEAAATYGITIAIEPLNRGESNCINSVKEGAMLEADADTESVGLLADLYHMLKDNEPMDDIILAKNLKHTHIALLEGRAFPTYLNDDVKNFLTALKNAGYDGTISIEGKTENLEKDAESSLKVLRCAAG